MVDPMALRWFYVALTACGESRSSSPLVIGEGIDRIDPAPYTVAHGHGHPRPRTTSVVDCRVGSAGLAWASVLHALECVAGCRRLRHLRGRRLSILLRAGVGPAESGARSLLPLVAGWVLRRHRFGARHRVACGGLAGGAELPATRAGGGGPGSLDDFAHRRCCTNPHWPARCQPTGFSPADAIRHWSAEGGHPIEDFAAEDHLTSLPGWAPGAKAISDDGFVAEERILHPALTMVP